MSMFENRQYCWRETYFVLFRRAKRPTLKRIQAVLSKLNPRYVLANPAANDKGQFESLSVLAPDDCAALDISYVEGEEVVEQAGEFVRELATAERRPGDQDRLDILRQADARFDVLHFEQVLDEDASEDAEEMLDPSTLLVVLDALVKLTGGVAVDPQSGSWVC